MAPLNLGSGEEIAIRELAALVADLKGFDGEISWDTARANGQQRRRLNVTRAERLFGFRARTALRECLERTVTWHLEAQRAGAPAGG